MEGLHVAAEKGHDSAQSFMASLITSDGMLVVDGKQRIVEWSPALERMTGLPAGDVAGRFCYEVLADAKPVSTSACRPDCAVITNARRRRSTQNFDIRFNDGDCKATFNVSTLVAPDCGPNSPHVVHLLRDVSDHRTVASLLDASNLPPRSEENESGADRSPPLSRRERQVITLLAGGYGAPDIAQALGLSPITVRNHITRAMTKLGARNRLDAVVKAAAMGII